MLSAAIYSAEALDSNHYDAINYGLQMIGQHVGGIALSKTYRVKLPTDAEGQVDHARVGYDSLDIFTDLHIFAAPMQTEDLGIAWRGTGIAWLNLRRDPKAKRIHTTSSHEVGHALGFVKDSSVQHIKGDSAHCSCNSCIMHPIMSVYTQNHVTERKSTFDRFRNGRYRVVDTEAAYQQNFCGDCITDMRKYSAEHISAMRHRRLLTKSILSKQDIRLATISS